jgi:DNA-binding CsgD family transcriptional regulator
MKLTDQQMRCVIGAANGWSNMEIAQHLDITVDTVKSHMRTACQRLSARNRTHLVAIAISSRIIDPTIVGIRSDVGMALIRLARIQKEISSVVNDISDIGKAL